jgi:hypothetical protein
VCKLDSLIICGSEYYASNDASVWKVNKTSPKRISAMGSSINNVTVLGEREGHRFCDDISRALVIKSVTMVGGRCQKIT